MTISEAAARYGLTADTLRYYERIGIIPPVPRDSSGKRDYDESSCGWIELMKCFRSAGVQIEALVEYVELYRMGEDTAKDRRDILVGQRERLAGKIRELQESLELLDRKIAFYDANEKCMHP